MLTMKIVSILYYLKLKVNGGRKKLMKLLKETKK